MAEGPLRSVAQIAKRREQGPETQEPGPYIIQNAILADMKSWRPSRGGLSF